MNQQGAKKYVPNANLQEVFADGIQFITFDGSNIRFELTIARPSEGAGQGGGRQGGGGQGGGGQGGGGGQSQARHPAARLVLPLHVIAELSKHFGKVLADLEQRGIKPGQGPGGGQGRGPGGGGGQGRGPGQAAGNELGYYGPPPGSGQGQN